MIWRTSSLTLLVVMAIGGIVPVLSTRPWFDFTFSLLWIWSREAKRKTFVRQWIFRLVVDFAYITYIIARILIFVEIFLAFRALPRTRIRYRLAVLLATRNLAKIVCQTILWNLFTMTSGNLELEFFNVGLAYHFAIALCPFS